MARKNRSSPAEDIIALAALLPWWLAVLLAISAYVVLHGYASAPPEAISAKPGEIGRMVTGQMARTAASIGQYLLPFLLLLGAAGSVIARIGREKLLSTVATGNQADALRALHAMSWQQFEHVIGQYFRTMGFRVAENSGAGPDGGVDLALTKGAERYLVQCKQWRATKVGVTVVRELFGVMAAEGATGGYVISAGTFSADAKDFARGRNITLIDGPQLARIIRAGAPSIEESEICPPTAPEVASRATSHGGQKTCPVCGNQMMARIAKRGSNVGQSFWGCSGFPECRGTLPR